MPYFFASLALDHLRGNLWTPDSSLDILNFQLARCLRNCTVQICFKLMEYHMGIVHWSVELWQQRLCTSCQSHRSLHHCILKEFHMDLWFLCLTAQAWSFKEIRWLPLTRGPVEFPLLWHSRSECGLKHDVIQSTRTWLTSRTTFHGLATAMELSIWIQTGWPSFFNMAVWDLILLWNLLPHSSISIRTHFNGLQTSSEPSCWRFGTIWIAALAFS